ncbi:Asp-tRNA Asn/Glu-tRNA Gln amidotransferase subunit A [Fulvimarina pelagi HTCC2506]|uniref:Asp-tRNA Asn/Glu-tRNA Gln amidotransferase subunit A n=2 Tax=Fulvimarina pelagi TaxID=217511 RepID=Q0FZR6_9HYPH|nr:Asp-tRNA Asn/Glu-tRNA Gln amidotransferase subunit A [Fulvimarina pelagi HTCC2506]
MPEPLDLPVAVLRERLVTGAARCNQVCDNVLKRLARAEGVEDALAWIDDTYARRVAESRDALRGRGRALGSLHGIPIVLDDACDMERVPSKRGFDALDRSLGERDASLTALLRSAGALLFAKSAIPALRVGEGTTGATTLLAKRCFPLAVTVEARGEMIRAAARSSLFAYRPSAGMVPQSGLFRIAPTLDNVAVLAIDLEGLALLVDALVGQEPLSASEPKPHPQLGKALKTPPPVTPTIGFVSDDRDAAKAPLDELMGALGRNAFQTPLPEVFAEAVPQSERIFTAEAAKSLAPYRRRYAEAAPETLEKIVDVGESLSAVDYLRALDWRPVLKSGLDEVLSRCDVVASIGPIENETSATFDETLLAFVGLPFMTLPLLETSDGSPLGLTLAAKHGEDARLMRTAAWLLKKLEGQLD